MEIGTFSPGPGNGRTYTSLRPDSFDAYASQRPSGENTGAPSPNGVLRNARGWSLWSRSRIQMSCPVCGSTDTNASFLPSGDHDSGRLTRSTLTNFDSGSLPSIGFQ